MRNEGGIFLENSMNLSFMLSGPVQTGLFLCCRTLPFPQLCCILYHTVLSIQPYPQVHAKSRFRSTDHDEFLFLIYY